MAAEKYSLRCVFPSLPKVERGKFVNLGGDPKGENFLYANGNNVYIRNLENVSQCDIYSEHQSQVTVAKYSPSRFYIASGDSNGKVRIWDTVNKEHILKNEFPVLGGPIKDIDWSPDSTKIVVVGEGREYYAKVITADSGNSVGDIGGHHKHVNGAAYRPTRPFRICTVSEDFSARFFEGPPFKCKLTMSDHSNFVNTVKYHPKGEVFITGSADGTACIYDGTTAELIGKLGGGKAHGGGIYSIAFSPDGTEVLTVSGDRNAKIWNLANRESVNEFKFGTNIEDMMVGCLWSGDNILTLALNGYISYLDRNSSDIPKKVLKGHYRPIMSMAATPDRSNLFTGGSDGLIFGWDVNSGLCEEIKGKGHSNQVTDMVIVGSTMVTIGMDDIIRYTDLSSLQTNQYGSDATKLPSQPKAVAASSTGTAVVACINDIVVVDKSNIMFQQSVKFEPSCVDIHCGNTCVVFGSAKDSSLYVYDLEGCTLTNMRKHDVRDVVTTVKFSPDGAYLTVTNAKKQVIVLKYGQQFEEVYSYVKHAAKIFSLAWSPNSQHYATGGLDGSIVVWRLDKQSEKNIEIVIQKAHYKGYVSRLTWLSDNVLVSAGNDSNIKHWDLKLE